jgi:hypothetical protein
MTINWSFLIDATGSAAPHQQLQQQQTNPQRQLYGVGYAYVEQLHTQLEERRLLPGSSDLMKAILVGIVIKKF